MGSIGFSTWRLNPEPLRLVLLVVQEGHGSRRIVLTVPPAEVLGNSQGVSFSVSAEGTAILQDPAYRLSTSVTPIPVEK
jgi:hypothetical protein